MEIQKFLRSSPAYALIVSAQRVSSLIDSALRAERINFLEALILIAIFFEKDRQVRPATLAENFATSKANISHCLSALESSRLVRRKADPRDRRRTWVSITENGEKKALRLVRYFDDLQRLSEEKLGKSEIDRLMKQLDDLHGLYRTRSA